jgi:predicted alpha-1,6-mannanase (GH76 family)
MDNNHLQVTHGFRILLSVLAPYITQELKNNYEESWWQTAVIDALYDDQKRDLPTSGDEKTLTNSLDIQRCLLLFDINWNAVFRKKLSIDHRTWAKELVGIRNRLAHLGGEDFTDDDTWRALDTMSRLCDSLLSTS